MNIFDIPLRTFLGLAFLIVGIGLFFPTIYWALEALALRVILGKSVDDLGLRKLARRDFRLLIQERQSDRGITRPFAVLFALGIRIVNFPGLIRMLFSIKKGRRNTKYSEAIENLVNGWRDSLDASVLREYLEIVNRLEPPDIQEYMWGRVAAANVTYLLGNLAQGKRKADANMAEARSYDSGKEIGYYKWLSSYAYSNSRLFLGDFHANAEALIEIWQNDWEQYTNKQKKEYYKFINDPRAFLDPVASIPRHLILLSAFSGEIPQQGQTLYPSNKEDAALSVWASHWYSNGIKLCKPGTISADFTNAYLAISHIVGEQFDKAAAVLEKIKAERPLVSQYAKFGSLGLLNFAKRFEEGKPDSTEFAQKCLQKTLECLRKADACSRHSGNRFLDVILLPVHAAAASLVKPSLLPESRSYMTRAFRLSRQANSPFYRALTLAAEATIFYSKRAGKFRRKIHLTKEVWGKELDIGIINVFKLKTYIEHDKLES